MCGDSPTMPNSRRRKKQVMASRRQMDKSRRRLQARDETKSKETAWPIEQEEPASENDSSSKGWLEWCTSGVTQVRTTEHARTSVFSTAIVVRDMLSFVSPIVLQTIETAKDIVFPTRAIRRRLYETEEKLRSTQEQLERVKEREARERRRRRRVSGEWMECVT